MNIIYLHGLSSSGQTNTAKELRKIFKDDTVISPDIPVSPKEALSYLRQLVAQYNPEETVIIGTSMGAFFAQMLNPYIRILVNPAFHVTLDILDKNLGNKLPFFTERLDGATEFEVTEELIKDFKDLETWQFCRTIYLDKVMAFFGDEDDICNWKDEYLRHYTNYEMFHGGHRMNHHFLKNHLVPYLKDTFKNQLNTKF